MAHSIYLANLLNDHVLKGVVYNPPANVYIALFTSDAGLNDDVEGSQTEVSGGSYARLTIDNSTLSFTTSVAKESSNNEEWVYATNTTPDWGTVTDVAVMSELTSGHVLYWGPLAADTLVEIDDTFRFLAGAFDSLYS